MNLDALEYAGIWFETQEEPGVEPQVSYPDLTLDPRSPDPEAWPYCVVRMPLVVQTSYYKRRPDGGYGTDDLIAQAEASASDDLVCALIRGENGHPPMTATKALISASQLCERCMNALAHQYGLYWGYPEGSEEWNKAKTSCPACMVPKETQSHDCVSPQTPQ